MTKARPPLTFELALTRIAAVIGWQEAAAIVGFTERTVRNWSDPDTSSQVTVEAALRLDIAFRAAGGDGAPMFHCYRLRLEAEAIDAFASADALAQSAARAAKESGEAVHAAIVASRPGATDADRTIAERELEESIAAATHTLATLRAGRMDGLSGPGGA